MQHGAQLLQCWNDARKQHTAPTMQQSSPYFEGRGVKGYRRKLKKNFLSIELSIFASAYQPRDAPVGHFHSFGFASGAGRVHDIGEILGGCTNRQIRVAFLTNLAPVMIETNGPRRMFR